MSNPTNPTPAPADFDVVVPVAPTDDAAGARVLRFRPGELSLGEVRPIQDGKPCLGGEIVQLERRPDSENLYDVKVAYRPPASAAPAERSKGPAQVATTAYRHAWDRTFRTPPS